MRRPGSGLLTLSSSKTRGGLELVSSLAQKDKIQTLMVGLIIA